jgi:hypothetical protein
VKLIIPQLLKKLPAFYGTQRSLRCSKHPATCPPVLRLINLFHSLPSYAFIIHFNIIIPSKPRTFKWFLLVNLLLSHPPHFPSPSCSF